MIRFIIRGLYLYLLFVDKQTGILLKYEYKTDVSIVTMEMEQIAIDQDDQDDFYLEYIKNKKN